MENKLKIGDTVRLKINGSPIMMVNLVYENGNVLCIWFDTLKVLHEYKFILLTIEKCDLDGTYFTD